MSQRFNISTSLSQKTETFGTSARVRSWLINITKRPNSVGMLCVFPPAGSWISVTVNDVKMDSVKLQRAVYFLTEDRTWVHYSPVGKSDPFDAVPTVSELPQDILAKFMEAKPE